MNTGSERAQQLFKHVWNLVRQSSRAGEVSVVTESGIQRSSMLKLLKELDLDKYGLELVKRQGELPLLKKVEVRRSLEVYSDFLHDQMTKLTGLVKGGKRNDWKSGAKQYKLNWNLSANDLENVKLKEILTKLAKNHKIEIYMGNKSDLNKLGPNFLSDRFYHIDEIEKIKREKLVDTVDKFIELNKIEAKIQGDLLRKLFVLSPSTAQKLDLKLDLKEVVDKNLKKQQRRERELLKLQRKNGDSVA